MHVATEGVYMQWVNWILNLIWCFASHALKFLILEQSSCILDPANYLIDPAFDS